MKTLGRETNGSLDSEVLVLGAVDEISADYDRDRARVVANCEEAR